MSFSCCFVRYKRRDEGLYSQNRRPLKASMCHMSLLVVLLERDLHSFRKVIDEVDGSKEGMLTLGVMLDPIDLQAALTSSGWMLFPIDPLER